MKFLITVLALGVAVASCSSIGASQPREDDGKTPFPEDLVAEPIDGDSQEVEFVERSILSSISTAASLISTAKNNSLSTNLKTVAALAADTALTAVTGSEEGAALAKTVIGVAGEAVVALSSSLSNSSLANSTLSQALLNATTDVGELLSEYGSGNETLSTVLTLISSVTSGNLTLKSALTTAGVALLDNTLTPTKEKITIAGTTLEVIGGVVETLGESMSDAANSTTEEVLESLIETLGVDSILNTTFSFVDSTLNITLEDIISEKLADLDTSTSSIKVKVVSAGNVMVTVGSALVTIGETFEDLGDSSVSEYVSIITEALEELTSNSTTTSS